MLQCRFDSEETERALKAALSDMHQVAGWVCHDLGDHASARRYLTGGLALAREINDLTLIAGAFYRLGRVSIHQGRAQEALRLWQLGQIVAQDSGSLVAIAVLHANEAWAYAMLGSDEHVRDAIARAEGELTRVDATTLPSWARFFLAPAEIDGVAGFAYSRLAMRGEHRAEFAPVAIERTQRALEQRQPGASRSRTFDSILLATAYLIDGQLDQAEQYGHVAIDMTADQASVRAVDRLREAAAHARRRPSRGAFSGVIERIDGLAAS